MVPGWKFVVWVVAWVQNRGWGSGGVLWEGRLGAGPGREVWSQDTVHPLPQEMLPLFQVMTPGKNTAPRHPFLHSGGYRYRKASL